MSETAKLLSPAVNFAVVQLPGRRYPGVVVQGDTLDNLVKQLVWMKSLLERGKLDDLSDEIADMSDQLSRALAYYRSVCEANSIS